MLEKNLGAAYSLKMKSAKRARLGATLSSLAMVMGVTACVGDAPAVPVEGGAPDASSDDGGSADGTVMVMPGVDGAIPDATDATAGPEGGTDSGCTIAPSCVGSTLHACTGDTACSLGCIAMPSPHCGVFNPTGEVAPEDFAVAGVTDITLTGDIIVSGSINTDTGAITGASGTIRAANTDPAVQQVIGGIGFRRVAGKIGIFQFKSLVVTGGPVVFSGSLPAAFVAQTTITLGSELRVQACVTGGALGGSGGGGSVAQNGGGAGGGAHGNADPADTQSTQLGAAGGGGYFASGGTGAAGQTQSGVAVTGANGGPAFGDQITFDPLVGGAGGGGAVGGAGGGAILVTAGQSVTIGGGASSGGVNAGGCSGTNVGVGINAFTLGGGGSGGTILVEAPSVVASMHGVLAANGASGTAPFADNSSSFNGGFGSGASAVYPPPSSVQCVGQNGAGGAGGTVTGSPGVAAPSTCSAQASRKWGGAGGGSVGRIRILTKTGTIAPDATFVVSPSQGTGATTIGTIAVE